MGHHLEVKCLITILFRLVNIVDDAVGALLVEVGDEAIDLQTLVLLAPLSGRGIDDDVDLVHMFQLLERLSRVLHLAPQGIDRTGAGIDAAMQSLLL